VVPISLFFILLQEEVFYDRHQVIVKRFLLEKGVVIVLPYLFIVLFDLVRDLVEFFAVEQDSIFEGDFFVDKVLIAEIVDIRTDKDILLIHKESFSQSSYEGFFSRLRTVFWIIWLVFRKLRYKDRVFGFCLFRYLL
jgi:hypothetical protein